MNTINDIKQPNYNTKKAIAVEFCSELSDVG
jgi:hypothetical protein